MRLLLDTHSFLWFVLNDPALSPAAERLIVDPQNEIEVSPATYWEIAIKISTGKYSLTESLPGFMEREITTNRFRILPIEPRHVGPLTNLPFHHRDPFDRLLVAQAMTEQIPIVSNDTMLDAYPVTRLW
ncbi:MAG TPA: type II toxin-antitoxin system VapC family toxin [Blastocatellia bacterium]|nr:type II toxin-antitoxin system VapC family toxin [Blastocatellia bacterium]HMV81513.1 type II toxin-antitoxin system VapC family toxin [Blastocatellia bacterium]HMY76897.1 type II toxin-antitoxin system VapC family toxin [Blastocatellia bacterium]HMZ21542.1 type II toxin-antitoxin system VapC family toxin [Blastocatellia bacterium]HNG28556.1 type II toxin-antitoxin system VapC family toxin [Blastocatellia bacterium]